MQRKFTILSRNGNFHHRLNANAPPNPCIFVQMVEARLKTFQRIVTLGIGIVPIRVPFNGEIFKTIQHLGCDTAILPVFIHICSKKSKQRKGTRRRRKHAVW